MIQNGVYQTERLVGLECFGFDAGCIFNVHLSCCHLVEHLPLPGQGAKSRLPWCSTLGFIPAALGEMGTESSRGMEGDHERELGLALTLRRRCALLCPGGAALLLPARRSRAWLGSRGRDGGRLTCCG